jgi:hypothetical protein
MRLDDRILRVMMLREQIIVVADLYASAAGIGRKRMSTIVFNRGAKLDDIASGGDLATGTFERAMLWFSIHWPEGADWPEGVPRPVCAEEAA